MLKRINKLPNNSNSSISYSTHQYFYQQKDIDKLFQPPYRELFQLDYLYSSPLYQTYPAFIQVVNLLENYNSETMEIDFNRRVINQSVIKNLSMRFIYREMLSIAIMTQKQIQINNFAQKLKNWYYQLTQRHSFLQGINFKKIKVQQRKLQDLIRQSYTSNVFDEIDDYMRKKINYNDEINRNQNIQSEKRKSFDKSLPLIDIQLYKRQQAYMQNYREKAVQNRYLKNMKAQKSHIRQISLNSMKNRQFKTILSSIDPKNSIRIHNSVHNTIDLRNSQPSSLHKNLSGRLDADHIDWRKKPSQISQIIQAKNLKGRVGLTNINGINLINWKNQQKY